MESDRTTIRNAPPGTIDAARLVEYVKSGNAHDLHELCVRSDVSLEKVALLVVASGLENMDKLPGYAVTERVYRVAEQRFSRGETARLWRSTRTRHNPEYLEAKKSRSDLDSLAADPEAYRRYHIVLFFQAWAVFWDDEFLERMINKGDSRIIASVPGWLLTEKACFAAVSNSGSTLRHVPEYLRTWPVCLQAVRNDSSAIGYTPARWREQIKRDL